jgi:methyl-accepting chemotaxis protein
MKNGKKVMIVIAGLGLAAASVLGGIFFKISRQETPDPDIGRILNSSADNLLAISAVAGGVVIVLITVAIFIMARDSGGEEPVRQEEKTGTNDIGAIEELIVNINDLTREINRQAKSISQSMTTIKQELTSIQTVTRNAAGGDDKVIFNKIPGETFDPITLTNQIRSK